LLLDRQDRHVLPPSYDEVGEFSSEGVALVRTGARWNPRLKVLQGGKFGYVICQGEEIARGEFSSALPWREGSEAVKRQHSWGFIVTNKKD